MFLKHSCEIYVLLVLITIMISIVTSGSKTLLKLRALSKNFRDARFLVKLYICPLFVHYLSVISNLPDIANFVVSVRPFLLVSNIWTRMNGGVMRQTIQPFTWSLYVGSEKHRSLWSNTSDCWPISYSYIPSHSSGKRLPVDESFDA